MQVLHNFNLDIEDGTCVVLLGPSGVGKTTFMRILAGLDSDYQGHVYFESQLVDHLKPAERHLGIVFQDYALYPHLTVAENIGLPLEFEYFQKEQMQERVFAIAERCHIADCLKNYPSQLSGGQKQRVAFARALANQPKLLLLDEPFSSLDNKLKADLRIELKALQRDLHLTVLLITHSLAEATSLSDRIAIMNQGTIEQIGSYDDLYFNPQTLFVAEFLNKTNHQIYYGNIKDGYFITADSQFKLKTSLTNRDFVLALIRENALKLSKAEGITMEICDILNEGPDDLITLKYHNLKFKTYIKHEDLKDYSHEIKVNFDLKNIYFFDGRDKHRIY